MAKKKASGVRSDFVEHGSEQHAALLGLRTATEDDKIVHKGYALMDVTAYGPTAREDFLETVLRQRVSELMHPPAVPQSKNATEPDYAPDMHRPEPTADEE